jgi:hypothetical protein
MFEHVRMQALRDIDSGDSDGDDAGAQSQDGTNGSANAALDFAAGQEDDPAWMAKARALERIEGSKQGGNGGQDRQMFGGIGDRLLDARGSQKSVRRKKGVEYVPLLFHVRNCGLAPRCLREEHACCLLSDK